MYEIKPIIDSNERLEIESSMYPMKMIYDLMDLSDVSLLKNKSNLFNSIITNQINSLLKVPERQICFL